MSSYFGLDVGASGAKLVKAEKRGKKIFVQSLGSAQNAAGTIDFAKPEIVKKLAGTVKGLLKDAKISDKKVVVSVPESRVYSQVIQMPVMADSELDSAIKWEAEQLVPIPIEEVELDYSVVKRPEKGSSDNKMLVYLVASRKKYLNDFVDFLIGIGLEPIAVESEAIAVSRSLGRLLGQKDESLVIHLGALSSSFSVISGESLMFSHVIRTGGVAITRSLSQSLGLSLAQAEEYKRTYGLDAEQLEGKVRKGILVILQNIVDEARKAVNFVSSSYDLSIKRLILSGGGAYMPEFPGYMSEQLQGVEVDVADPFIRADVAKNIRLPKERAIYDIALGLALRE